MAKKATTDELLAQFDDLGAPTDSKSKVAEKTIDESDPLAGLEQDLAPRSRPHTPRVGTASPRKSVEVPRKSAEVPRSTEPRKSTDSARREVKSETSEEGK